MSSRCKIGVWEDGSARYCYFRRHKHYRIKENGFRSIRWKMFIANSYKIK